MVKNRMLKLMVGLLLAGSLTGCDFGAIAGAIGDATGNIVCAVIDPTNCTPTSN